MVWIITNLYTRIKIRDQVSATNTKQIVSKIPLHRPRKHAHNILTFRKSRKVKNSKFSIQKKKLGQIFPETSRVTTQRTTKENKINEQKRIR